MHAITLLQNLIAGNHHFLRFYYPMNLHYFKTSKENIWNCYQCMYHKVFNYILLYNFPFVRKNILTTMLVQICSTTLRFCTSPNTPIGIWSCYWHKNHANTLLQNHPPRHGAHLKVLLPYEFTLLQNSTSTYYTGANCFTTLRFCTSSDTQRGV